MGGETAFDWGEPLGTSPNDAVANNLDRLLEVFRFTHCNYIGWLASYNKTDPVITRNAAEIQKTLGYRFVLDQVSYSKTAEPGGRLAVSFSVKNTGSSPIYYNWPVEVSLLDPDTHQPVWRDTFQNTDITSWLPDSDYSCTPLYSAENTFNLPADLPAGEYILALSILDPDGGMLPAALPTETITAADATQSAESVLARTIPCPCWIPQALTTLTATPPCIISAAHRPQAKASLYAINT